MKKTQRTLCLLGAPVVLVAVGAGVHYYDKSNGVSYSVAQIGSKAHITYAANIVEQTKANTDFRKVLFTGTRSQLVIMSIPPGGEVGEEIHTYTEQTLFFLSGTGEALVDGKTTPIGPGDVVIVTPGTKHNFINTGSAPLKIYTVYAPSNHIDGTIEATAAEANANTQDEAYSDQAK